MREKIFELLREFIPDLSDDESVNLVDAGLIDSFGIANLIANFEKSFGIEIDGEDIVPEYFYNVTAMEKLIKKYIN